MAELLELLEFVLSLFVEFEVALDSHLLLCALVYDVVYASVFVPNSF